MKITHIETFPVLVPIKPERAIKSARGYHTASPFLFLHIHTDTGLIGVGKVKAEGVEERRWR